MPYDWVEDFLKALSLSPSVTDAARAAGIQRATAYTYRKISEEFAGRWDDALEQSTDALVNEMFRRAVHGTEKPVYQQGVEVGRIREYSDTLAIFLAKAHRREVYGDKLQSDITSNGKPLPIAFIEAVRPANHDSSDGGDPDPDAG
jgi:hypothetical protein